MRFKDLKGRTSLPVERVRAAFRDDDVITVLPVDGDGPDADSVLVATPHKLVIVTRDRTARSGRWLTRLAPWAAVGLQAQGERVGDEPSTFRLRVRVSQGTFDALLRGAAGREALRDFVLAVRGRRRALGVGLSGAVGRGRLPARGTPRGGTMAART